MAHVRGARYGERRVVQAGNPPPALPYDFGALEPHIDAHHSWFHHPIRSRSAVTCAVW